MAKVSSRKHGAHYKATRLENRARLAIDWFPKWYVTLPPSHCAQPEPPPGGTQSPGVPVLGNPPPQTNWPSFARNTMMTQDGGELPSTAMKWTLIS